MQGCSSTSGELHERIQTSPLISQQCGLECGDLEFAVSHLTCRIRQSEMKIGVEGTDLDRTGEIICDERPIRVFRKERELL